MSRQIPVGRVTRCMGMKISSHSKLIALPAEQLVVLDGLVDAAAKIGRTPERCGSPEFGCLRLNFEFDMRLHPGFTELCNKLITENARDERPRRITSSTISIYTTTKVCSTRDNRVMLGVHRDDGTGDDLSLIFGLSHAHEYSGGLLRVAATKSGDVWRRKLNSNTFTHKRGTDSYDVSYGRVCVLQNPEHSVQRLHWGRRVVAIVTAKPSRR